MDLYVEYLNGKVSLLDKDLFNGININLVKKIYYSDNTNQYGFYRDGRFYTNNCIYDFKIKIENYDMIPIQYKTGLLTLNNENNNSQIIYWNIGYELKNNEESFRYTMSINYNGEVYFEARHYNKNNIMINNRKIKLQ